MVNVQEVMRKHDVKLKIKNIPLRIKPRKKILKIKKIRIILKNEIIKKIKSLKLIRKEKIPFRYKKITNYYRNEYKVNPKKKFHDYLKYYYRNLSNLNYKLIKKSSFKLFKLKSNKINLEKKKFFSEFILTISKKIKTFISNIEIKTKDNYDNKNKISFYKKKKKLNKFNQFKKNSRKFLKIKISSR